MCSDVIKKIFLLVFYFIIFIDYSTAKVPKSSSNSSHFPLTAATFDSSDNSDTDSDVDGGTTATNTGITPSLTSPAPASPVSSEPHIATINLRDSTITRADVLERDEVQVANPAANGVHNNTAEVIEIGNKHNRFYELTKIAVERLHFFLSGRYSIMDLDDSIDFQAKTRGLIPSLLLWVFPKPSVQI